MLQVDTIFKHLLESERADVHVVRGCAQLRLRQNREAQRTLEDAFSTLEAMPDASESQVALARMYLVRAYNQDGKPDSPQRSYHSPERALPVIEKSYGRDSIEHARMLESLGNKYRLSNEHEKAITHFRRSMQVREALGRVYTTDIEAAYMKVGLGRVYVRQSDFEKGIAETKQASEWFKELFGTENEHYAWALRAVGTAYLLAKRFQECRDVFELALPLLEAGFGPEHSEVRLTLWGLGQAYSKLGDCRKAIDYLEHAKQLCDLQDQKQANELSKMEQALEEARQLVQVACKKDCNQSFA